MRSGDSGDGHRKHHRQANNEYESRRPAPHVDTGTSDKGDAQTVHQAGSKLLGHDLGPVAQGDFTQGQPAQNDGQGLRTGVARLTGHNRQQDGERGEPGDRILEDSNHSRRYRNAVARLICNQGRRLRMAKLTFERARSSLLAPVMLTRSALSSSSTADTISLSRMIPSGLLS